MRLPSTGLTDLWVAAVLTGSIILGRSSKRRPLLATAVGFACGTLCFVHFFEWVLGVLTLFLFAAAAWRDEEVAESGRSNLLKVAGAAAAISGGYYLFAKHLTSETMHDTIYRSSMGYVRFSTMSIPFLLLAVVFWRHAVRRDGTRRSFWTAAAATQAAAFIVSNLQLVLGYDLQFESHAAFYAIVSAILASSVWLLEQEGLKRLIRPHALVLIAACCAWFGFATKSWADLHYKFYGIPQDVADASTWMNANVPKGSLLLAPSISMNWLLPLESEVRFPTTFTCAAVGAPITTEANLRGLALILKNLDIDPSRFAEERWLHSNESRRGDAERVEDLVGNLDWESKERNLWPGFLIDVAGWRKQGREDAWVQIARYFQEAGPLREPFYAWIQKSDLPLLRRSPTEHGGRLIYSNPSVSLYSFPNGAQTAATPKRSVR